MNIRATNLAILLGITSLAFAVDGAMATATYTGVIKWRNPAMGSGSCFIALYDSEDNILESTCVFDPGDTYVMTYNFSGDPLDDLYLEAVLICPYQDVQVRYEYDIDYPADYTGYTHWRTFDFTIAPIGLDDSSGSDELSLTGTTFGAIKASFSE